MSTQVYAEKLTPALSAQAPDMLEMLKRINECQTNTVSDFGGDVDNLIPEIRALIKRAEGREDE